MKNLVFGLMFLMAGNAMAEATVLEKGDEAIHFIKGKVTGYEALSCPHKPGIVCELGLRINIEFPVYGCANRLGPVSHTITRTLDDKGDTKWLVQIAAVEIENEMSKRIRCIKRGEKYSVVLGLGFFRPENVEVNFLGE